jgi:quercetin dioxygenase-like cupin family protein
MTTSSDSKRPGHGREEVIERGKEAQLKRLAPGTSLRPLVGAHNGAERLFTGLISLDPAVSYLFYARPVSEGLILIDGEGAVDVLERRYRLRPLDAIHVPEKIPRRLVNRSATRPALFHVAIASASPDQTWVNGRFDPVDQSDQQTGLPGIEHVSRRGTGTETELAPGATFQEFYGSSVGAHGICGGHGAFGPGARLPCHRHDFDESITIIQGTATCTVEGRTHLLWDRATALVPRGSCHYFSNLTREPMAMIWVYASGESARILMDEARCHPPA